MPHYDFICQKCKKSFSRIMNFAEHEAGKVVCPKCKSKKVEQKVTTFFTVTSKKS